MSDLEVSVLCYWNGYVKYGSNGVYYYGSTPRMIKVKRKGELSRLLDQVYQLTGLNIDNQESKVKIFGRYPSVIGDSEFLFLLLPVVDENSLKTMLEVPSKHPSIKNVELYLEVKSDVVDDPGSSLKRRRTQHPFCHGEASGYVDRNVTHVDDELEVNADFGNGVIHGDGGGENMSADNDNGHKDLNMRGLEESGNACFNKGVRSSAPKPWSLSNLWVDDYELRVGLCFKDKDELKKAVDWCAIRGRQKCFVRETEKDKYTFECIRWKCNWSLGAARMEEHGLIEITKFIVPHTCCPTPIGPGKFNLEFAAAEIECLLRVQPTLTLLELEIWWRKKFGYGLEPSEMLKAKLEAIKNIYGDWDQSFRVLPKLMAALQSSNGLVVDWQYDLFPNPEFASFRGVFWAFPQSIEGFLHCKPLIIVDSKKLEGKYPLKLMIASGFDAEGHYFMLAFAVTIEDSSDSWRWFLTAIREKVTHRKELCLISSPDPDILDVVNEPGSQWAHHRLSLDHIYSLCYGIFKDKLLTDLVEKAGLATQQVEFLSHMETIKKKNAEARRWLDLMSPHQWALAHDGGWRYGVEGIDTKDLFSFCENFQSLDLPPTAIILILVDMIRSIFHKGFDDSKCMLKCGDVYTKPVMEKLEEFMSASIAYVVMPLEKGVFQVTEPLQKDEWLVQLSECTCSCGEFQRKKFPCLHALAVCEKLKINPLQYVDDCYSLDRYCKTYAATFSPVPEVSAWPEASDVPTLFPPILSPKESGNPQHKPNPHTGQKSKKIWT